LLTVIAILGLLIAMLAPTVVAVQKGFKISQTRSYLEQLRMGIENYENELGSYPPSDGSYPCLGATKKTNPSTGAAGLVQCMLGYKEDDGQKGPGFRQVRAGVKCGPYVEDKLPMTSIAGEDPRFLDAFGNEILYYRAENGSFDSGNNPKGPSNIMDYITNRGPDNGQRKYYRLDYLLITPGPDREWAKNLSANTEKVDDITNFTFYSKETQP